MNWSVVARGRSPSGESVVHLCSRTGRPASEVRTGLVSPGGFTISEGLERDGADSLAASLSFHGITIEVIPGSRDTCGFRVVLTGYAPGSRGRLRAALMRMSGRSDEEVIGFLARIPFALRRGASAETAASVRRVIEAAGGVVEIRPEGTEPPRPSTVPEKPLPQATVKKASQAPVKTVAASDTPPEAPVMPDPPVVSVHEDRSVLVEPHRFTPAPPTAACIEPGMISPVEASVFQSPYKVLFTGPARLLPVPPAGSRLSFDVLPAADTPACHPVFLCPVQEGDRTKTIGILQNSLGLSLDAAMRAIAHAPSVISLEPSRDEASERVRELSGHGLPVTLIKTSEKEGPVRHRDHVWFGNWLRGR